MSIPEQDLLDQAVRHYIKVGAEWDGGDTVPLSTARVALLDAARAYGVAVGRSGFHDGDTLDVLAIQRARQLRASIDATGRAVDDHESRLAQVEFGVEQWKEQGLLARIEGLEAKQAANEGLMAVAENLVLGAGETSRITASLAHRVRDLEEGRSVPLQPAATEVDQLRADLALAQEEAEKWKTGWERMEADFQREKAEHAEASAAAGIYKARAEHWERIVYGMLNLVPGEVLSEVAGEPPF